MNLIDLFIVVFVTVSLFRGSEIGFTRQAFSTLGFFGGLWLGATVQPIFLKLVHTPLSRSFLALTVTLGLAFIFLAVGEYVGLKLKRRVHELRVNAADDVLGALLGAATLLIAVWLGAAIIKPLPFPSLQTSVQDSAIVSWLDNSLPPAPNVIANIGRLIYPNGFPQVFTGSEPAPSGSANVPAVGNLQAAVRADEKSVVKIEGQGCGGIVEGSGFVVGNDLVATNAHVVAGIAAPYVTDAGGVHRATPIWFDPDLDFAVLRVSSLAGKPLVIKRNIVANGTTAAVLGYPGGGGFEAGGAVITNEYTAIGRNIYNQGIVKRNIYELRANVIPGNSGGPVIAADGTVAGVVFAESTSYRHVGYALTAAAVNAEVNQAAAQNQVVGTGGCAE